MEFEFVKMQGLGNDFVVIDTISQHYLPPIKWREVARKLCDRHFGIGADQILLLLTSEVADFKMLIFNSDGSQVEMCGNGIRCIANYIWEKELSKKEILNIETLTGNIRPQKVGSMVKVDMGEPVLEAEKIPVKLKGDIVDYPLIIKGETYHITCVSMGNPHAIIVTEELDKVRLRDVGLEIENHDLFPKRTNVEFIKIVGKDEIRMRVWERGSGETLACGTGASAVCVASAIKGLTGREVTVHLDGGDLLIHWNEENNRLYMTGPAEKIFEGKIEI